MRTECDESDFINTSVHKQINNCSSSIKEFEAAGIYQPGGKSN